MVRSRKGLLKNLILGFISFMFITLISSTNKVYAGGISILGSNNIEVYSSPILYVGGATRTGDWMVYTKNSGKYPNNSILTVTKKTVKNGHTGKVESYIICHGKNAGTARIYVQDGITGVVGYKDITITRRDITRSWIDLSKTSYIYDGTRKTPTVKSVKLYGTPIQNYRIRYTNNINAGTATVYIDGLGNNCGTAWRQFRINPVNISNNGGGAIMEPTIEYTGKRAVPYFKPYIRSGAVMLSSKDYTYSLPWGDTKAERKKITITGRGNYCGSFDLYYTITKRNIKGGDVYLDKNSYTYTGGQIKPKVTRVTLSNHTTNVYDYKVEYGANTNSGHKTGWVKVTGTNNNTGSIIKYFNIDKRSIAGGRIELKNTYSKKTAITKNNIAAVYTKSGTRFYDYKIVNSYLNNNKTKATITIEGTGNNTGKITQTINLSKVQEFLKKASEIQEYMYKNNYTYGGDLTINYKDSQTYGKKGYHHVVCATLVSWSLIESGIMEPWELQQESDNAHQASVSNFNHTKRFKEIYHPKASDIKAGDIIIYGSDHHHVEIAADDGRNYVFNAGGNDAITGKKTYLDRQKNYSVKSGSDINDIDVILRLK